MHSQPASGWLKAVLSASLSCFLTSAKGAHAPLHTYEHQDKTNCDEQVGHSHHIHPSADSQRHGRGSVGHQYQGQHEEEEPACNSLVSCQKPERTEAGKPPHYEPQRGTLGLLHKTGKAGRKTKFGVGRNYACSKGPKSPPKDVVKQVPALDCWCLCPCPRVLRSYRFQALKSVEGSTSFMLEV